MAIDPVANGESSPSIRSKINALIAKVNAFDTGKVDNSIASGRVLGRSAASTGAVSDLAVSGGLEVASSNLRIADGGVTTAKLGPGATTNAKMADMAYGTFKGRVSAGSGSPQDITVSQARGLLGIDTIAASLAALDASLSADIAALNISLTASINAVDSSLSQDIATLDARTAADIATLNTRVAARAAQRPTFGQAGGATRPGEAIGFFSGGVVGAPDALAPLDGASVAVSASGPVGVIKGAGVIAPVACWAVEPGHVYRIRYVVQRAVDTDDPANDAVRLGAAWLKADKTSAGTTDLANILDITVADGRAEYIFTVSGTSPDADASPPVGGVFFRPFARTFGGGVTYVEVIQVVDATDAVVWSPNVEMLRREIAALTAQVQSLAELSGSQA